MLQDLKAIVTGGAGFIGSHLVAELLRRNCQVTVIDNFSSGRTENIEDFLKADSLTVVREDLRQPEKLERIVEAGEIVFHLAANPEVRVGQTAPGVHFEENVLTTFNLLEAIRRSKTEKTLIFTSTSTVYGEATEIPTPEDYGPLAPISTYGASKLASEALISSYVFTFNQRALILRLANIVGSRSNHGVIADFIKKISANPKELEILGDGKQEKSYMHITDFISALIHLTEIFLEGTERIGIFNAGSRDRVSVTEIAKIVAEEMRCPSISYRFSGGVNGGRGWKGDIKVMQLSIQKLVDSGWRPQYSSKQAVTLAARELSRSMPDA